MHACAQTLQATNLTLSRASRLAYAPVMESGPEDSALMLRYKDGDVAAFDTLYRRHKDPLYRYLFRLCRHRDSAEDIVQDVWGKIIKARDSYRPTAKFTTFLYRVAHNCFIEKEWPLVLATIERLGLDASALLKDAKASADAGDNID